MINAGEMEYLLQQTNSHVRAFRKRSDEIAESEAVRLLGIEYSSSHMDSGYNLVRHTPSGVQRLKVKGVMLPAPALLGPIGPIDISREWDAVLLVLLNDALNALSIFEAPRISVLATHPGSDANPINEIDTLDVARFKSLPLAHQVWPLT
jgi:hypothetical protein